MVVCIKCDYDQLTLDKFEQYLEIFSEQNKMLMSKLFEVLPGPEFLKFALEFRERFWPEDVHPDRWTALRVLFPELFMEKK